MSKTQPVKVHIEDLDKDIEIKKLPLGKYSELLSALDGEIPKLLMSFDGMETSEIITKIPTIIGQASPEVMRILSIATREQLTVEEFTESVALDEAVEIVMAAWEVNNFAKLYDRVKKAIPAKRLAGVTDKLKAAQASSTTSARA